MKKLLLFILIFPFGCFSQEKDTVSYREFENFFGSICMGDTLIHVLNAKDQLIFYKKEHRISRMKNGKVKWTTDLKRELNNFEITCADVHYPHKYLRRIKRKTVAIIWVRTNDEARILKIRFSSGVLISNNLRKTRHGLEPHP